MATNEFSRRASPEIGYVRLTALASCWTALEIASASIPAACISSSAFPSLASRARRP
jgi:hypothetical protein